ncbi:MAG: SRPBCC family protein, partial [Acidimicrobiia bacterium]
MADTTDVVSVERVIASLPEPIFALLADPARHREIDGSGTVRAAKSGGGEQVTLGSKFGMSMKMGLPYSMESTVIEFEPNRRIAWQTRPPGVFANLGGGRIWRYELEPQGDATLVRESWDISEEKVKAIVRPAANKTREAMKKTLERIAAIVAS